MPSYSVVAPDGQLYGPADESALGQWAREGRIAAHTQLHCHETGARVQAGMLPTLQPLLGLPPALAQNLMQPRAPLAQPYAPQPAYGQPQAYAQPAAYGQPQGYAPQPAAPYGAPIGYVTPAGYANAPSSAHYLTSFSGAGAIVLHFLTCGIFTFIHFGLMHGKLPRVRPDDPSAGKAIGFMFIPLFNIYWLFFSYLRLIDRVNEQRRVAGLPPSELKGLFITSMLLSFVPFINFFAAPILFPIFLGSMRGSVNELVRATRPGM